MQTVTINRPDDWHIHLRDGEVLRTTVADVARVFGRAIVMPNLVPPVTTVAAASAYRQRILAARPSGNHFEPLMTLYLTDTTTADTVNAAAAADFVHAFKLYPAGATTNSDAGVSQVEALFPVFAAMEAADVVLCIHGEVTDSDCDVFDREARFLERELRLIVETFPRLRVVLEHITTREAVDFVRDGRERLAATITAHHLLYNRNDMLAGGMRPLYFCLPILKREEHRRALVEAAISGDPRFFLGTDSAPHPRHAKEQICGCAAGCYTAHAAIELYAEVFAGADALDKLEGFASHAGADFYGLPRNTDQISLEARSWTGPATRTFGREQMVPLRPGEAIAWQVT